MNWIFIAIIDLWNTGLLLKINHIYDDTSYTICDDSHQSFSISQSTMSYPFILRYFSGVFKTGCHRSNESKGYTWNCSQSRRNSWIFPIQQHDFLSRVWDICSMSWENMEDQNSVSPWVGLELPFCPKQGGKKPHKESSSSNHRYSKGNENLHPETKNTNL